MNEKILRKRDNLGKLNAIIQVHVANPEPRTYIRGVKALPLGEVRNINQSPD